LSDDKSSNDFQEEPIGQGKISIKKGLMVYQFLLKIRINFYRVSKN